MIKLITDENMNKYLELAQIYEKEFAHLTGARTDENGLYPVSTPIDAIHIGYYYCENKLEIGFMVINIESEPYDVCEFFILKEHRKRGSGQKLAFEVFDLHNVEWSVKQLYDAKQANSFWIRVIGEYTGNAFSQQIYEDEKWGKVHMQTFSR